MPAAAIFLLLLVSSQSKYRQVFVQLNCSRTQDSLDKMRRTFPLHTLGLRQQLGDSNSVLVPFTQDPEVGLRGGLRQ